MMISIQQLPQPSAGPAERSDESSEENWRERETVGGERKQQVLLVFRFQVHLQCRQTSVLTA